MVINDDTAETLLNDQQVLQKCYVSGQRVKQSMDRNW